MKIFEYIVTEIDEDGTILSTPGEIVHILAKDKSNAREKALLECVECGNFKSADVGVAWDVVVRPFV